MNSSDVTKFINRLFESREQAHVFHLQSGKYSEHIALDEYYKDIVELIDSLVETYQGEFDLIGDYSLIKPNDIDKSNVIKYFTDLVEFISSNRYKAFKKESHLQSIIDDIIIFIYQKLYKLKNLK